MVPPLTLCAYMKKGPNLRWSLIQCSGGDEGDRTPDLLTASQALSQLSYAPVRRSTIRELGRRCKENFEKLSPVPAQAKHDPPAQPGFPCSASPIIGPDCEPPLLCASELCRFTTMNQECSITHAFSRNRRAPYLRFCKRGTRGARESPISRSKLAVF